MKIVIALLSILLLVSCGNSVTDKPDRLIDEPVMVDIFYDLSLLEAIKAVNPISLETNSITTNEYIYKKYTIDSLQFAQSNQYYASDLKRYKKIYEKVNQRLAEKKAALDTLHKIEDEKLKLKSDKKLKLPTDRIVKDSASEESSMVR